MNRLSLFLVAALVAACSSNPTGPGPAAFVTIFPGAEVVQVAATFKLTPTVTDANALPLSSPAVTWSSSDATVATVDANGIVTGVATGSAIITATSGAGSGTSAVTVPGPATKLAFTVQPTTDTAGKAMAPVKVAALDAQGNPAGSFTGSVTVTLGTKPPGGTLSGTTTVAAVAGVATFSTLSVDKSGADTLYAAAAGLTGAKSAAFTVTGASLASLAVTPNPATLPAMATQQFTAVGKDALGNVVSVSAKWSVVANGGTIDNTGLFTAGATAGTFTNTVQATSGTFTATATVIVPTPSTGPAAVGLGTAGNYVILAKSGISNVPTSAITGNLGVSPAPASFITGFALSLDATGTFSTSAQVTGNVYAADYTPPTPLTLTTAVNDMVTAYNDAAGRTNPDYTELAAGNIGGLTLPPGLYKWSNTVLIPTDVTLSGSATDVWIFQIAGGLTQASATNVILTGGALAKNVFWQVAGVVAVGTTADLEGEVLSLKEITLNTGAVAHGSLLAQTQVTLSHNIVVKQ